MTDSDGDGATIRDEPAGRFSEHPSAGCLQDGLVSIVTPAYECEAVIEDTIASVEAQTYQRWEHLIVDDGSMDDTAAAVEAAVADDARIRLLRHDVNRGPAAARNTGIAAARGRWLAFVDADDLWLPNKLEIQLGFMRREEVAFSFTAYRHMSEGGKLGEVIEVPSHMEYHDLLKNTAIVTSTMMIDRAKTGPIELVDTYYDDLALKLELLKRGFSAYGIQKPLMNYRLRSGSVSRNKLVSARWVWHLYRHVEDLSWPYAAWVFVHYLWNGIRKYA